MHTNGETSSNTRRRQMEKHLVIREEDQAITETEITVKK